MDISDGTDERVQLEEVHADARLTAVERLSRSLACAAGYASQLLPRSCRVKIPSKPEHTDRTSLAKTKALATMKGAPKHKFRMIKFTGTVTVPVEAERVPAPVDVQSLPKGWTPVCYKEGPPPVGKPTYQLKTYRASARRQRQSAGLAATYKRPMQAELVPGGSELDASDAVSDQDAQQMEQWLAYARERLEAGRQKQDASSQQQKDVRDALAPSGGAECAPLANKQQPALALPAARVETLLLARARVMSAVPVPDKSPPLRFQGDLHAPAAAPTSGSATTGVWQEVPAPEASAAECPKLCSLTSVPPDGLRVGVPRSRFATLYKAKPGQVAGHLASGVDVGEGPDEDVVMTG